MSTLILTAGWITVAVSSNTLGSLLIRNVDAWVASGNVSATQRANIVNFADFLMSYTIIVALIAVVLVIITIAVGFMPTWIALVRNHHNKGGVILTNVFLDWTIIGWIAAFIMSLTSAIRRVIPPERW